MAPSAPTPLLDGPAGDGDALELPPPRLPQPGFINSAGSGWVRVSWTASSLEDAVVSRVGVDLHSEVFLFDVVGAVGGGFEGSPV